MVGVPLFSISPRTRFLSRYTSKIVDRVEHGFCRLGFDNVKAVHDGDGRISLICNGLSSDDHALILAATQTVPGVTAVSVQNGSKP